MSLAQFAKASGLSKGHASTLENGLAVMSVNTVYAAARALGVPPFLLCMREEDEGVAWALEQILGEENGDVFRAAVALRALILGPRGKRTKRRTRAPGRPKRRARVRPGTIPSASHLPPGRGEGRGQGLSGHARPTGTLCRARTTW